MDVQSAVPVAMAWAWGGRAGPCGAHGGSVPLQSRGGSFSVVPSLTVHPATAACCWKHASARSFQHTSDSCMSSELAEHCTDGCTHRLRGHGRGNGDGSGLQTCGERGEGRYCSHAPAPAVCSISTLSARSTRLPAARVTIPSATTSEAVKGAISTVLSKLTAHATRLYLH